MTDQVNININQRFEFTGTVRYMLVKRLIAKSCKLTDATKAVTSPDTSRTALELAVQPPQPLGAENRKRESDTHRHRDWTDAATNVQ